MSLIGKIAAVETANGALMVAVGNALPPLLPQINHILEGLASGARASWERASHAAFDVAISDFARNVEAVQN
jgi:hypothetical protein